jgi:hypothetical protein
MTLTPEIINRDLAIAFGGWSRREPKAFDPHTFVSPDGRCFSAASDYFHSNALAIELLESASTREGWHFSVDRFHVHRGCEINAHTKKWVVKTSDASLSEAICLALHAAGIELGIIKGDTC